MSNPNKIQIDFANCKILSKSNKYNEFRDNNQQKKISFSMIFIDQDNNDARYIYHLTFYVKSESLYYEILIQDSINKTIYKYSGMKDDYPDDGFIKKRLMDSQIMLLRQDEAQIEFKNILEDPCIQTELFGSDSISFKTNDDSLDKITFNLTNLNTQVEYEIMEKEKKDKDKDKDKDQ